jgi:hypothetical protein
MCIAFGEDINELGERTISDFNGKYFCKVLHISQAIN